MSEIVEEEIVAKPFEITLPTNGGVSFILCGASRSGKTCLMRYLYKEFFDKHISLMFSLNTQADIYKSMSKKTIVSPEFLPEILSDCHTINVKSGNKYPFLIISDDFVGGQIKNAEEVTRLLTVYRNANMSSIFSFQGRTLINPTGRASCNYIAILAQQTPQAWHNVCKEYLDGYLPMSLTMPEKIRYCQEATRSHQFFFIDNIIGECYISKLSMAQMATIK
jgi:ribosomal protein S19